MALAEKGETYREIAKKAGVSPNTIKAVLNRAGLDESTSTHSRAFELYSEGKTPLQVAITLNLKAEEAIHYHCEYFMLLVGRQLSVGFRVYATEISEYDSGRDMGCADASSGVQSNLRGHTKNFAEGYYDGITECGPAVTQPSQSSQSGGLNWVKICSDLQVALVSSCDILVNPDNTLTTEGERAVGCIRNGIILAGGGTFLMSLPLPSVIAALQILEEPTGYGGIVEWGLIGDVNNLPGIIQRLSECCCWSTIHQHL